MSYNSIVANKSFEFSLKIIDLYKHLVFEKKEYVLSKQLLRSGTAIGAIIREGIDAQSKKDFLSKMNIALKESKETQYWIELLTASEYLDKDLNIINDCIEISKILTSIVKTTKNSIL
ncbi:MAG: four helix bundle protein [Clostridiales bacterium]|nr:four helix bundle protein [Clostridiales bacterium]